MSGSLSVDALSATYVLPRTHPDETAVRLRLDRVARQLDRTLETPLLGLAAHRDEEVWLFRRLDAAVELDLAADDDALARAWADGVAAALAARLRAWPRTAEAGAAEVEDGVAWFAGRAEQLASFVADLASGVAWSRWWHQREFDGLRPLPEAAAIERALARDPARGRAALAALAAGARLAPVVRAMGAPGAARLVELLYGEARGPAPAPAAAARALARGLEGEAAVLFVCAETADRGGGEAAPAGAARDAVARAARDAEPAARTHVAPPAGMRSYTRLGGAFLLLSGLASLGANLDAETRLLVLRSALGSERAFDSGADPVLAYAAGVGDDDDGEQRGRLATELVRTLLEDGRTDAHTLAVAPTKLGTVVLDPGRDVWLGLAEVEVVLDAVARSTGRVPVVAGLDDAALASLENELAYYALPAAPPEVAPAGRALVRALARRLGGLERSSPQHLWRNVLDRPARVDSHAAGLRVELGPAPLDVLLRLSGIAHERFEVPWLGEVELSLAA